MTKRPMGSPSISTISGIRVCAGSSSRSSRRAEKDCHRPCSTPCPASKDRQPRPSLQRGLVNLTECRKNLNNQRGLAKAHLQVHAERDRNKRGFVSRSDTKLTRRVPCLFTPPL